MSILSVVKKFAYVVLGMLASVLLIFNPEIINFVAGTNVMTMLESMPSGFSGPPAEIAESVNWYTAILTPIALYGSKRFIDWFFEFIMPHHPDHAHAHDHAKEMT